MKKIFTIFLFLCLSCGVSAFADESDIHSDVVSIDPEFEFFVIQSGEGAGIELGDGVIVERDGKKVAEGYIIEVRQDVSAAEILDIDANDEIRQGDSALIVKKAPVAAETVVSSKLAKPRWATILGTKPQKEFSPALPDVSGYRPEYYGISSVLGQGKIINITLHQDPDMVFSYARMVLIENGYTIVSSNRAIRTLQAAKPLELSLLNELLADAVSAIDHNVMISLEIKDEGGFSKLSAGSFREHFQKGKYIKRNVTENSKYYNELVALISEIKKRSEY